MMAKSLPWEDLAAFKNLTHSAPKETNFFIKVCPRQGMRRIVQN
jgi:hypothetical protein